MKRLSIIIAAGLLSLATGVVNAQEEAASMSELLRLIEQGQARDSQEARQREAEFNQQRNQQQNLLNRARAERTRQENESARLEQLFEDNQTKIVAARAALDERLGALKELFGVLQTVSGDTQGRFNASLTNLQYPERETFLVALGSKMASATELAQIEDIERLWFELQREINESGKVARFNHLVTKADGQQEEMEVVRVGAFNLISDNGYLEYDAGEGSISELLRQPDGRITGSADDLFNAEAGYVNFGVDVTRGGILGLLVETPTLAEKVDQGGIVGYSILALGAVGLLIAIWRFMGLSSDSRRVSAQLKQDSASTDNPLGRVLAAYESNKGADTETIELKLSEAALKEMPGLT
ncbi:MAG: energy transducer TonB, partial [Gammaproteobacteria bacterium]|nr:energy transducer TonB [Gammaproteobacteria bacterium]